MRREGEGSPLFLFFIPSSFSSLVLSLSLKEGARRGGGEREREREEKGERGRERRERFMTNSREVRILVLRNIRVVTQSVDNEEGHRHN